MLRDESGRPNAIATRELTPNALGTLTLGQNLNARRFDGLYMNGSKFVTPEPLSLNVSGAVGTNLQE